MDLVAFTALGVGGATVFGAVIGFFFRQASTRFAQLILAFSAGVMLAASVFGLIMPALDSGSLVIALSGIFCGAVCMDLLERLVTHLRPEEDHKNKVMLFVAAIAIHNLPEGIAAGVGFGTGDAAGAFMIASGIALQNIPEGMVIIGPMLATGLSARRTFLYALLTGLIEVIGTFLGYFAVTVAVSILPFSLALAGGTMLFIICGDMIPQTCCGGSCAGSYALLGGFCAMLVLNAVL